MKEMNLKEFKKEWECFAFTYSSGNRLRKDAIELLESQQAEIEQLKAQLEFLQPKPKLIGYRNLIELWDGKVKIGSIWTLIELDFYEYKVNFGNRLRIIKEVVENSPNIFEPVYEEQKQDYSGLPKIKAGTFFADYITSRNNDKYPNGVIILP